MLKKCILLLVHAGFAFGTTAQWTGATNNIWTTTTNWNPNNVPMISGDTANLTNASPSQTTITLNGTPITLTTLNLDIGTGYTINGGGATLTFSGGNPSINVSTVNGNGVNVITAPISIGSALSILQNSTGSGMMPGLTIGPISGSSNLTLDGTGTLLLTQDNSATYSGQITIDTGTLEISADNNLGQTSKTLTINSGTLLYDANESTSRPIALTGGANINTTMGVTATLMGTISGAGSLTTSGDIVLANASPNTYQGGTTVAGGTLSISSDSNLGNSSGSLNISNGTLQITSPITIARSGTFSNNAVISSGATNHFTGSFNGAGNLTVQGGGTFVMTGSNSYTGGTTVAAGTQLSGTTNGLQGNITLANATSLLTFSQNFNGTYAGVLTGPLNSQLTLLGTGQITFTGSSPAFLGTTSVQNTLILNGSLENSPITVTSGGTLGGSGTAGPTTSTGLIYPGIGDTISNLTIDGTLDLMVGSHVNINLAPLISDRITVDGNATLTGPLRITPAPGFYGFSASYTILTSTGLMGTFSPVTSINSAFVPSVTTTATDVILDIAISAPFALFPFSNENTAAVGHNIDALFPAGELSQDLIDIFNSYVGQSNATINAALDQMHPAPYSAFTEMQAENGGQLISLFHRLPYLPCSCKSPSRLWIEGLGNSLTMKNHGIQLGFQGNTGGIAFGYDGQITEHFLVGIGGAWTNNHLTWKERRGKGVMNGFYGGIYFDSIFGDFYFGGSCLAGKDFYTSSRHIALLTGARTAKADFQAWDVMAQLSAAYLFGSPQAFFYPYANLDYLYLNTETFSESGADGLNLTVFSRVDGTLRTELGLGLQIQDRNISETMCISPLISLGWVNMCPVERPKLKSTFEGATIPFQVVGWDESWNLFNVNFGLTVSYCCYSLMMGYNVEISPDSDTTLFNQHGNLRFDWKW